MVVKYKGKITYKDGESIEFEIDENDQYKFEYNGVFHWESQDHLNQLTKALISTKRMLASNSPKLFEMEEL